MPRARLNGRVASRDLPLEERKDNGALKAGASEACALDPRDIDPMTAKRKNPGARWEITVDGTPRGYRDDKAIAIGSAESLKERSPMCVITVRDLGGREGTVVIPPQMPR
jgi:hypothetical protein